MKRLAAFALLAAGIMVPGYAQRGASHGGFSGHGGQNSHGGGFIGPTQNRPSGGFSRNRPRGPYDGSRHGNGDSGRRGDHDGYRYRRPYVPSYAFGIPYAVTPWLGWDGSPDSSDNSAPAAGDAAGDYSAQPYPDQSEPYQGAPYPGAVYSGPPYPGQYQALQSDRAPNRVPDQGASERPPTSPESEEAITLIFKDGRPPEQIHNYILSRTTLYIQDKRPHSIPIEQLDIAATGKANVDAGIDFRLPVANP